MMQLQIVKSRRSTMEADYILECFPLTVEILKKYGSNYPRQAILKAWLEDELNSREENFFTMIDTCDLMESFVDDLENNNAESLIKWHSGMINSIIESIGEMLNVLITEGII